MTKEDIESCATRRDLAFLPFQNFEFHSLFVIQDFASIFPGKSDVTIFREKNQNVRGTKMHYRAI